MLAARAFADKSRHRRTGGRPCQSYSPRKSRWAAASCAEAGGREHKDATPAPPSAFPFGSCAAGVCAFKRPNTLPATPAALPEKHEPLTLITNRGLRAGEPGLVVVLATTWAVGETTRVPPTARCQEATLLSALPRMLRSLSGCSA